MTTIFSSLSIPPLLSLFSSSTFPHPLWQSSTDPFLPEDSLLLHFPSDSPSSSPSPFPPLPPNAALVPTSINNKKKKNGSIAHPVVHLQSPNVKTTFLRFPPKNLQKELGLPMEWIHFVLKPLGKRELVLEVGVKDGRGFRGVVRISTFTTSSHLSSSTLSPTSSSSSSSSHPSPPLLLLPLLLPTQTSSTLTPYVTVSLSLSSLLSHFSTLASSTTVTLPPGSSPLPTQARGASWNYIKIYANCRLRRVWASLEQGAEGGGRGREELGVWGVEEKEEEEEEEGGEEE